MTTVVIGYAYFTNDSEFGTNMYCVNSTFDKITRTSTPRRVIQN